MYAGLGLSEAFWEKDRDGCDTFTGPVETHYYSMLHKAEYIDKTNPDRLSAKTDYRSGQLGEKSVYDRRKRR